MTEQPLALQLADSADACQLTVHDCALVAKELRRLHGLDYENKERTYRLEYALKNEAWDKGVCPICNSKDEPQREWVGLTQQDINIAFDDTQEDGGFNEFAKAIEQTLKRKNT